MNAQEFCYWLQGFFELSDTCSLSPKQVEMIRKHLSLVFIDVTSGDREGPFAARFLERGLDSTTSPPPNEFLGGTICSPQAPRTYC